MIGKITDERSMSRIISSGIIPAIGEVLSTHLTVDEKVSQIGELVNAYNQYYLTGREQVEIPPTTVPKFVKDN